MHQIQHPHRLVFDVVTESNKQPKDTLANAHLWIDDRIGPSMVQLEQRVRQLVEIHDIDLIIRLQRPRVDSRVPEPRAVRLVPGDDENSASGLRALILMGELRNCDETAPLFQADVVS